MDKDDELLSTEDVAKWIKSTEASLRRWRKVGEGPVFLRLGRQIRYRRSDVSEWLNQQVEKRA